MPTFSAAFGLNKTQSELDFVNVSLQRDNRLFLDPFALSQERDRWSVDAATTIGVFFQQIIQDIHEGNENHARRLLSNLHEPNETRLGFSRGRPQGAGIGEDQAEKIFEALRNSEAVRAGFISALEESELMIDGIGHDKISDLTTNVIRARLIEYTQEQCTLHGVAMEQVATAPIFSADRMAWEAAYANLPVFRRKPILLVPKNIVRYHPAYHHGNYYQHYVLNFLQAEELNNPRLGLVRIITNRKRKTERRVVYKEDLKEVFPRTKQYLYEFSRDNPDVLAHYREYLERREQVDEPSDVDTDDETVIATALAQVLPDIERGNEDAGKYHNLMIGIVEFLFYPKLDHPRKEQEIHDGRKRIDIVMENNAQTGIFHRLSTIRGIPCSYVPIECKNYGREVANPELDQLAGRFSVNRGKVGLLCCREFANRHLFVQRCRDTFRDDRGLILPVDDAIVTQMLNVVAAGNRNEIDDVIANLVAEVTLV